MQTCAICMYLSITLSTGDQGRLVLQKPNRATAAALEVFHNHDYIQFLQRAKQDSVTDQEREDYNVMEDCPVFHGVFQFCQIYAGASIHGAQKLVQNDYDIAINWAGGLHHAKKSQAEGGPCKPYMLCNLQQAISALEVLTVLACRQIVYKHCLSVVQTWDFACTQCCGHPSLNSL